MPNLELHPRHELSVFRRLALGTWKTAYDPSVYGTLELRMEATLDYLSRFREATGKRLTLTHLVGKAMGAAMARMPDANAILRWGRPYRRKRVGVFFQIAMTDEGDGKVDLSGTTLHDVDKRPLLELMTEFEEKVSRVRKRDDPAFGKARRRFKRIPALMMKPLLNLTAFLGYTLNLDMVWAGVPKDAFGSVLVTNIGSLGLDVAYPPLVPYSRVPMVIAVGAVKDQPVVAAGAVVVGKVMRLSATFDHRLIDGYHASIMARVLREWFAAPDEFFGAIPDGPSGPSGPDATDATDD